MGMTRYELNLRLMAPRHIPLLVTLTVISYLLSTVMYPPRLMGR
jgi:hypothetical protein